MAQSQKEDTAAVLVARFLRSNNYEETLEAFLAEAGLPPDAGTTSPGSLTIEKVLEEKNVFDLSRNFEKTRLEEIDKGWTANAPHTAQEVQDCDISANVLSIGIEPMVPVFGNSSIITPSDMESQLLVTAADRRIHRLVDLGHLRPSEAQFGSASSPTLCFTVLDARYLLTGTMSGTLSLYNLETASLIEERKDHQKYLVRLQQYADESGTWVASAGWDERVFIYHISNIEPPVLDSPCAVIKLPSNPQAISFVRHPDSAEPMIVASRRDSTFLCYYLLPSRATSTPSNNETPIELPLFGKQNLAPHSNAWIAFTPSSFAVSPRDPLTLAVATSHTPHMKVIIVKLLLPKISSEDENDLTPSTESNQTRASQARAEIAHQDREDAAILIQCTTMAPQSQYSTPELVWRPDGSGVWVNGDDGAVRGIETNTGKVVTALKGAHDPGTKIRCLWAGNVEVSGNTEEWLISGGFDRRLVVWRPEP